MPKAAVDAFNQSTLLRATCWLLMLVGSIRSQLTFRQDPSTNSFSVATPGFQQSFTRIYGGSSNDGQSNQQLNVLAAPQQAASPQIAQPTQQQYQQQPYAFYTQDGQLASSAPFPAPLHYQQEPQYQPQPQHPTIHQRQEQLIYNHDLQIAELFRQQAQTQQQSLAPIQAGQYVQGAQIGAQQHQQQQLQHQHQNNLIADVNSGQNELIKRQQQHEETQQKLLGVAFSPSNEVSKVTFSSNSLKYDF